MLVMKFGGTSVGSPARMRNLVQLVHDRRRKVVVLSAMSGTTDALLFIAICLHNQQHDEARMRINELEERYRNVVNELFETDNFKRVGRELIKTHFDFLRSFTEDAFTANEEKAIAAQGELLSTALFHFHLAERGIDSVLLPALDFMRIDEHGEPELALTTNRLNDLVEKQNDAVLFITQGYICRNAYGEVDNLKRGGSDYTATIIGAALNASEVQIWTDIDGMHNNDPRVVSPTKPITELSFDEAAELAYFGAKILHPTCVLPAQRKNIPVRLLNTMKPDAPGTLITQRAKTNGVKAVAAKDGIAAVNIKSSRMLLAFGFLRSIFEVFERYRTPVDAIATSEVAVSLTIDDLSYLDAIAKELGEFGSVSVDKDLSIVCIVGDFGADKQGYALQIFQALKDIPVRMISYGGSERNVTVVVKTQHKRDALVALNKGLFNL